MWVYLILAVPTLLMGATLPILVAWLERHLQNIGKSVGLLYAFNTVGSAFAAFFTVQVLFVLGGLHAALLMAVACNFATAWLIFDAGSKIVRLAPATAAPGGSTHAASADGGLSFGLIFLLLAAIGYISLSQEILWYRLLGFMTANKPQVFGMLLAAFLLGIAGGSLRSKSLCEPGARPWTFLLGAIACAGLVFYLTVPLVAWTAALAGKDAALLISYGAVALVAYCTGGILPLLMHVGVTGRSADSAQAVSMLYFANIVGATLGPLVTGFILLEHYSLEANIVLLSVVTLALLGVLLLTTPHGAVFRAKAIVATAVLAAGAWLTHGAMYRNHLEMLQYASADKAPFVHVLENRSGILTVGRGPGDIDIMYGNGIYDGRFNIDPLNNSNMIDRALMVLNLHRHPRKMLEIGLSTGSWTQVMASHPLVEQMTVVEINKGYPALIRQYPEIRGILDDPKIRFVFDDGRRWLRNHPDERFDFILMNTTYHWRSNSTNLLSADFLRLMKSRLAPGGVVYYNTTGSDDVVRTAAAVFRHVVKFRNFVAASDALFDMSLEERRANLQQFPVLARDARHAALIEKYAAHPFEDKTRLRERADLWITTDDNMAVEFKSAHY
jgi:spermidine synthase